MMRHYQVIHIKKDTEIIKAETTYEACKKYAQMKGLKSTAGVNAHLMTEEVSDEENNPYIYKPKAELNFVVPRDWNKNLPKIKLYAPWEENDE